MAKPKIIVWDLETSNLNANIGAILCMGWKVVGEKKTNIIKISDFDLFDEDCTDDYAVCVEARDVLTDCDGWFTWYGGGFDVPYLNSKLIYHGEKPLPPMGRGHIDGWRIARYKMKLTSNSLAAVTAFLGQESKTMLDYAVWRRAQAGHMPSLENVYDHCRQDLIVSEQVYDLIKPLHETHFNVNLVTGKKDNCPKCSAEGTLIKRGWRYAATRKKRRFQCTSCGGWSLGKPEKSVEIVAS